MIAPRLSPAPPSIFTLPLVCDCLGARQFQEIEVWEDGCLPTYVVATGFPLALSLAFMWLSGKEPIS
ncbi:hypothetical protein XA68_16759 [Ophiocordyceps unilateralis]|uniref:Uncharacterized protein n=1 Tax=Ophiocordyceps unilateralis TaxID=268505 RepID=A0A2A9P601_OPHUN|nr:hypothetical protein XA68_16759 [Ophiocordyceps unilateralis]